MMLLIWKTIILLTKFVLKGKEGKCYIFSILMKKLIISQISVINLEVHLALCVEEMSCWPCCILSLPTYGQHKSIDVYQLLHNTRLLFRRKQQCNTNYRPGGQFLSDQYILWMALFSNDIF